MKYKRRDDDEILSYKKIILTPKGIIKLIIVNKIYAAFS